MLIFSVCHVKTSRTGYWCLIKLVSGIILSTDVYFVYKSPFRLSSLCLRLKRWTLVATVFCYFLKIKWLNAPHSFRMRTWNAPLQYLSLDIFDPLQVALDIFDPRPFAGGLDIFRLHNIFHPKSQRLVDSQIHTSFILYVWRKEIKRGYRYNTVDSFFVD